MTTPEKEKVVKGPNRFAKGDGSVYQRASDGRWCGTVTLPSSLTGDRRRKTVTAKTKAEAEAKMRVLSRELKSKGDLPTRTQTFGSWANVWFTTIAVKKVRPKTAATYRSYLEQYILPVIGNVQLTKLTSGHVRRVHAYIESKGLSPTTVVQAHRIIAVCLRYAMQDKRVVFNVADKNSMDAPLKAVASLVVLSADDGKKVLREVEFDRLGSRWAAALFTGARQGELLGLELDRVGDVLDVSWQLQRLSWEHGCNDRCGRKRATDCPDRKLTMPPNWEHRHLTGGLWLARPKTKGSERIVPVFSQLREQIERRIDAIQRNHEPNPHGLLWTADPKSVKGGGPTRVLLPLDGAPIDPSRDNKAWHEVLRRAGVPDVRLHDARHTTASLLLKFKAPQRVIMQILGHNSYVTSYGYQDVDVAQMSDALEGASSFLALEQ